MPRSLLHVATPAEFELARRSGMHVPASLASEGFVHCCYLEQLSGVLERYFRGAGELALLEFDAHAVGELRHESPPGVRERFPHVYGALPMSALRRHFTLAPEHGGHALPLELREVLASTQRDVDALLAAYAWYDHPEGPKFVETHRDEHRTSGHWLFLPGAISAFHRVLNNEELWIAQRGALRIHVIDERGAHSEHTLGLDLSAGQTPVLSIPLGVLQAAELLDGESFAFGANVCAPPFHFERFELTPRAVLQERFPQHRALIERLTHARGA